MTLSFLCGGLAVAGAVFFLIGVAVVLIIDYVWGR